MILNIFFLLNICVFNQICSGHETKKNDALLTVPQLVQKNGYPIEEHIVVTNDSYIIALHRIPYGNFETDKNSSKTPVLLVHGLGVSSESWILTGPDRALAYILADSGYDVWMINNRGTDNSKNHLRFESNVFFGKYWNFSFHELAVYDMPAAIDYILDVTEQSQIFYVGFSQGGTLFFALCSQLPEYNNKIKAFVGLSAVAYFKNTKGALFRAAAPFESIGTHISNVLSLELTPHTRHVTTFGAVLSNLCLNKVISKRLCWLPLSLIGGYNPHETNNSLIYSFYAHAPTGVSLKSFLHFLQIKNSNKFAMFNYGPIENLQRYSSIDPPNYNLRNVNVPVYLFYGKNDQAVVLEDINKLISELPNFKQLIEVKDPNWSHMDYNYGNNAKEYVYEPLINILDSYN